MTDDFPRPELRMQGSRQSVHAGGDPYDIALLAAMQRSYPVALGTPFPPSASGWEWVHNDATFALLAHNTQHDPLFIYANQAAQQFFESNWHDMIGTPSRLTAAPGHDRDERARMFAELGARDFCSGYHGRRITKTGRAFWIEDAVIWNVRNASGQRIAQAAIIPRCHDWRT